MRLTKTLLLTIGLALLTCGLSATGAVSTGGPAGAPGSNNRLMNTQWALRSFVQAGSESPVLEGSTITLRLGEDGRASGSGGCNSYAGVYKIEGDRISFGEIISTKKACLDEARTRQEQEYFFALGSAGRFELADDRLMIFYDDGRGVLNFVRSASATSSGQGNENLSGPVELLASYYDAVNRREFERSYRYWETPPSSYEDFVAGYADTASVRLIVEPPTSVSGAAGSLYVEVPVVLIARHRDGSERRFAGCYAMRKSNLRPPDVAKEPVWRIYRGETEAISSRDDIPRLLARACED